MSVLKKDIPIYILYECQWRSLHSVKFPLVLWPPLINSDEKLFLTWLSTYCLGVFCLSWNSNWAKLIKLIVALKILLHNLLCTKIWKWAQEPYLSINQWSTIFSISICHTGNVYIRFLIEYPVHSTIISPSLLIVNYRVINHQFYPVEGGGNWAKLSQKWHPSLLFSLLLAETEKAQYITPKPESRDKWEPFYGNGSIQRPT